LNWRLGPLEWEVWKVVLWVGRMLVTTLVAVTPFQVVVSLVVEKVVLNQVAAPLVVPKEGLMLAAKLPPAFQEL